jgi:putative NIF3 family GTP cyclohydrolase 1 type 2
VSGAVSGAVPLDAVVAHLDAALRTPEVPDYPGALNGLQMANSGRVTRVAAAVDFSRAAIEGAAREKERLRLLLAHDLAVYGSHIPLDLHPTLGNNALLARALDLVPDGGFARYKGLEIGLRGDADLETAEIAARATAFAARHGHATVHTPIAPGRRTRRWGMCSGAGASIDTLREAAERGIDTLIVGEGPHHTAVEAAERGMVVIYAGHYATETPGVQALGAELERAFGLPWSFVGEPTGL